MRRDKELLRARCLVICRKGSSSMGAHSGSKVAEARWWKVHMGGGVIGKSMSERQ